jgi:hypothetical protein
MGPSIKCLCFHMLNTFISTRPWEPSYVDISVIFGAKDSPLQNVGYVKVWLLELTAGNFLFTCGSNHPQPFEVRS